MTLRILKSYLNVTIYVNIDNILYIEIMPNYSPTPQNPKGERIARIHLSDGIHLDISGNPEKTIAYIETGKW